MSHNPNIRTIYGMSKEPSGFPNRTDSVVTFDNTTLTLSVAPASSSFEYYVKGVKYTHLSAATKQITDTEGLWHFYFDGYSLQGTQSFTQSIITDFAYVALIYWDAANNQAIYFGEERHGMTMDGSTHIYLHNVNGAVYVNGLGLGDFTLNGTGTNNADGYLSVANGVIYDEDIIHNITDGAPQDIAPIAKLPVFFREGVSGNWRRKAPEAFPVIYPGSVAGYDLTNTLLAYNGFNGTTWSLQQVTNNNYVLVHVLATNDKVHPIIAILGTNQYNNSNSARAAAITELATLSGLPFSELVPVGTVIFQTSNGYTNRIKARIVSTDTGESYVDFRDVAALPVGQINDHGNLSGLTDADHPASAVYTNTTNFNGILSSANTTVQSALDTIDNINLLSGSGESTRVAFWSGASALSSSSNLYWDNSGTGKLGIGTSSPGAQLEAVGVDGIKFKTNSSSAGFSIFDRPTVPGDQLVFQGNTGNYTLFNVATKNANVGTEKVSAFALWPVDISNSSNATQLQIQNNPVHDAVIFTQKYGTAAKKKISLQTEWQQSGAPSQLVLNTDGYVGVSTASPVSLFSVGSASQFQVDSSGDIVSIKGQAYKFPPNSVSGVLTNNGLGTLTWAPVGGTIGGNGTASQIAYFTDTTIIGSETAVGSNSFTWDAGSNRLGIGTSLPSSTVDVQAGTPAGSAYALNIAGTLNTDAATRGGAEFDFVANGGSGVRFGAEYYLHGTFNAASPTRAFVADNRLPGTGTKLFSNTINFNAGATASAGNVNGGITNVGIAGYGLDGSTLSVGVLGYGLTGSFANGPNRIGVVGMADTAGTVTNIVGGYFGLAAFDSNNPTFTSAALIADNGSTTSPIFLARDSGSTVFSVGNQGNTVIAPVTSHGGDVLTISGGTLATLKHAISLSSTLANPGGGTFESGAEIQIASNGSNNSLQFGLLTQISGNYSGSGQTTALSFRNDLAGTGSSLFNDGLGMRPDGNRGIVGHAVSVTSGNNSSVVATAGSGNRNFGGYFSANVDKASALNVGVYGAARNTLSGATEIGGMFHLYSSTTFPSFSSAALLADNGSSSAPIFVGRDQGTEVFRIADGGNIGIRTSTPVSALSVGSSSQFQVSSLGDIVAIRGQAYSFPDSNATNGVLSNDGYGALTWAPAPPAALVVGSTSIASGVIGRILFEGTGNFLQESENLFWNNTDTRLGIGTSSPSSTLTVSGGLATGDVVNISSSANGNVSLSLTNATSGNIAQASLRLITDSSNNRLGSFAITSNGWTASGLSLSNQYQSIGGSGLTNGILIGTQAANAPIVFSASASANAAFTPASERFRINAGEVVVNDGSQDVDFRVESDNQSHMLFVDGYTDRVGIGTSSPVSALSVGSTSQFQVSSTGDIVAIKGQAYSFPPSSATTGVLTNNGSGGLSWSPAATGTVSSVILSTGSTGLTVSGGTTQTISTSGTFSLAGTLSVANGGTGQSTYSNGQLLIGNSTGNTLTKATLSSGTGISITNGPGSITITANGAAIIETNAVTASYVLALSDASKIVEVAVTSPATATVTVPLNSSVPFEVGAQILVAQTGTGTVSIAAASGVTINHRAGLGLNLNGQWAFATLVKRSSNSWVLFGDLV